MEFIHGNILHVDWDKDATILFVNGLFFPPAVMEDIEKRVTLRANQV